MKKNLFGISILTIIGLYSLLSVVVLGVCLIVKIPINYGIIACCVVLILQFLLAPILTVTKNGFRPCASAHKFLEN